MKNNALSRNKHLKELKKSSEDLRASEKRLHIFINNCKDYALLMLDSHGHIITWNIGAERIKGYKASEIIGKHFSILYPEEAQLRHYPEYELEMAVKKGSFEDEGWRVRKDGSLFWANVVITPLYDDDNKLIGFGKVTRDLSERKRTEEEIIYLSHHDSLTNLYNRSAFTEYLEKEVITASQNKTSFAVLLFDLDNFKKVNDSFGHHIGDQLLIHIAKFLQESVRPGDIVARLGGDEFIILFPDVQNESDVKLFAGDLVKHFSKPFKLEDHYFHLTVSIGIALYTDDKFDTVTLIKNADIAMYSAKESGRNNFQFYSDALNSSIKRLFQLENELPGALAKDQLFLVYQPQYSLPNKKIVGIEVLIRWQHPTLGIISPSEFIPMAEKNGMIFMLGEWVLRTACMQFLEWMQLFPPFNDLKISVNVSPLQLVNENFLLSFMSILEETQINPQNLVLEITETAVMTNIVNIDPILAKLKDIGVSLSIDDFGAGYSSFSRLRDLPVSSLKIDKSLIAHLDNDNNMKIVESIIGLGDSLGIHVIPEGVETEEQIQKLIQYDCKMVQGYYFGKDPFLAREMTEFLRKYLSATSRSR